MGSFDFSIPDDFIRQLEQAANVEELSKKMLNEAAPIVVEEMKKECEKHTRTRQMKDSVKQTVKAGASKQGGYITVVRPHGKDDKGIRNMDKLAYNEFGTSKQPADPLMKRVLIHSENQVIRKMQEVYNREVGT